MVVYVGPSGFVCLVWGSFFRLIHAVSTGRSLGPGEDGFLGLGLRVQGVGLRLTISYRITIAYFERGSISSIRGATGGSEGYRKGVGFRVQSHQLMLGSQ